MWIFPRVKVTIDSYDFFKIREGEEMTNEEKKVIQGKKVFFLRQKSKFMDALIERLVTMEYEIYCFDDHKNIKNALAENPDTILFIVPYKRFSTSGWKNYVKSIEVDMDMSTTQVGILNEYMGENEKASFMGGLKLKAGLTDVNLLDDDDTFHTVVKILDSLNAKGMRRNVRANCFSDAGAEVYWVSGSMMNRFHIIDISTVGMAISVPERFQSAVQPQESIPNAMLTLKNAQFKIPLDIQMVKKTNSGLLVIAIFQLGVSKSALESVRHYVLERNMELLLESISGRRPDDTNYNQIVVESENDLGI